MNSPMPESAFLSLGGFTTVHPDKWKKYLNTMIRKYYPLYYLRHVFQKNEDPLWTTNDCVLESLEKYLFLEFGMVIPRENLFQIYNPNGEGILPAQMIDAISSVIEPFGFEVDRVLAPDDELRSGLGHPDIVVDLFHADKFDGRAGICMINLDNGISHAFFWKKMDKRKFSSEQFRMAVLVRRKGADHPPILSAIDSIDSYCRLLDEYCSSPKFIRQLTSKQLLPGLKAEIQALSRYVHDQGLLQSQDFRMEVDNRINSILELFQGSIDPRKSRKDEPENELIVNAGLMIRRVFQEIEVIS